MQQAELQYFLMGGQQVAFDMRGDELQGGAFRFLLLARQAQGDPVGQFSQCGGIQFDHYTRLGKGGEPGRLARGPVELGQGDQRQHAAGQALAVALQRLAAVAARLAVWNAQVNQLVAAE